ncbi:nucleoside hydrolase [Corynebacterium tapiri]|uniref:Nucleoside hydrolase n=1 Tax=Corynebacterium tapiri TaxID=1448266 RepID=A0A5C4U5C9_9CORY|nr:nucleoside hydrolase [Corynebacterium tapiri]TNL99690.1 nucleoside hydrolase [Corynebacterium tapiri]
MTPRRVILDCDPGIDDTLALMYLAGLHRAGEIELVGVSTTAGNVDVDTTARNAAWVLELCGAEVPVAAGENGPKCVELVTTPETHGHAGLGYCEAPPRAYRRDWVSLWRECLDQGPAELIITGPMTNAAQAGELLNRFSQVAVMGGAINYRGNTTPTAEWNFWVDPHAAARAFEVAQEPFLLCPLNVTEGFLVGPTELDTIVQDLAEVPLAEYLPEIVRFYFEFHRMQGEGYQAQIHDALTIMAALGTVDVRTTETTVAVEADSPLMRGTSVADLRGHWGKPKNCALLTQADYAQAHRELRRAAQILAS